MWFYGHSPVSLALLGAWCACSSANTDNAPSAATSEQVPVSRTVSAPPATQPASPEADLGPAKFPAALDFGDPPSLLAGLQVAKVLPRDARVAVFASPRIAIQLLGKAFFAHPRIKERLPIAAALLTSPDTTGIAMDRPFGLAYVGRGIYWFFEVTDATKAKATILSSWYGRTRTNLYGKLLVLERGSWMSSLSEDDTLAATEEFKAASAGLRSGSHAVFYGSSRRSPFDPKYYSDKRPTRAVAVGLSVKDALQVELWASAPSVSVAGAAKLLFGSRWPSVSFEASTEHPSTKLRAGLAADKPKVYTLKFRDATPPVRKLGGKARTRFDALQAHLLKLNKNSIAATHAFTRAVGDVAFTSRRRTSRAVRSSGSKPFSKWLRRRVLMLADALPKVIEVQKVRAKQRHWRNAHDPDDEGLQPMVIITGALPPNLERYLRNRQPTIARCFALDLRRKQAVPGTVKATLKVDRNGSITPHMTSGNAGLRGCVEAWVRGLVPHPPKAFSVDITVDMSME